MSSLIIFETSLKGHRYEYLYNIYNYPVDGISKVIFVIPKDERILEWNTKRKGNVQIDFLTNDDLQLCTNGNLLKTAYYKSKILRRYVDKYQATHVFLIFLMLYMPFLLWMLPKGIKISGIVYRSFLWEDSLKQSSIRKMLEWVRYWLMAKSSKMEKVLLLNDYKSADVFNQRFGTTKFMRLPDPYTPLGGVSEDIKILLGIDVSDNLFIQIGQLSERKGTLEILDALMMLTPQETPHSHFYFAGKVADDIHEAFYAKMRELQSKGVHIYVKDEFVSFEFLNSLCASCDCMLTPYKNTSQSSGAIGYAAQYGKPVIGPSKGLLGYLLKHYRLGYQIDNVCADDIYAAISNFKRISVPDEYVKENQLSDFLRICLN